MAFSQATLKSCSNASQYSLRVVRWGWEGRTHVVLGAPFLPPPPPLPPLFPGTLLPQLLKTPNTSLLTGRRGAGGLVATRGEVPARDLLRGEPSVLPLTGNFRGARLLVLDDDDDDDVAMPDFLTNPGGSGRRGGTVARREGVAEGRGGAAEGRGGATVFLTGTLTNGFAPVISPRTRRFICRMTRSASSGVISNHSVCPSMGLSGVRTAFQSTS